MRMSIHRLCTGGLVAAALMVASAAFAFENYGTPTISCLEASQTAIKLQICGDAITGAPAGVSIHWTTEADYLLNGWGGNICELSLSGLPGRDHGSADSRWDLGPGECQVIQIGDNLFDETGASGNCTDPLECDTRYVFRIFAHADRNAKRSAFSDPPVICATEACDGGGCTRTQGYWGTHGPGDCQSGNNDNEWNVNGLMLGNNFYTDAQMCATMEINPPNCGGGPSGGADALVKLAHQLMAAKLNQAEGADVSCVAAAIAQGDALIGNLIVAPAAGAACIGSNSALGQQMVAVASTLDQYNNGFLVCADHCSDAGNPNRAAPLGQTKVKKATWGELKVIYR
jgi:hypothetical protein